MKIKHLILLTTTAVAASSLYSCKEEPYIITAEEEFTRNFIKEFGLIDPNQDWNLAEGSTVTVKVGSTPAEVKAYMKVDNTYYLVANLQDVAGDVKIPFDMPEGTTDIMVKINGTRYYTSPGGTVDPNAPTSRGLLNEGEETAFPPVKGSTENVLVTIEENPHGRQLRLTKETMLEALNTLPENNNGGNDLKDTNFEKVTDNFVAYANEFYVFPEYFQSDSYSSNIIGVYWYVDEGTPGAEEIHIKDQRTNTEESYYIVRVPFFQNPKDFLTPYDADGNEMDWPSYGDEYNQSNITGASYFLSTGVHVAFDRKIQFGFYLEHSCGEVLYSESKLNECRWFNDFEGNWYPASYVATFKDGTDTEENVKRHLCFEDWPYANNFDLNDMVFRVYGFDYIKSGSLGGNIDDLETDEDDDPTTPPTPPSTGGEEGDGDTNEVDEPYQWLLAVEDLGATDDFDFNDIIIGISSETVNTPLPEGARTDRTAPQYREVTFTALAAGGTLPAFVYYNEIPLYPDDQEGNEAVEWHKWFGNGTISIDKMINTGRLGIDNQKGKTCTLYFADDDDFPFSVAKLGKGTKGGSGLKIKIVKTDGDVYSSVDDTEIGGESYFIQPSEAGAAPQMFLIPDAGHTGGWKWPMERTPIQTSYKNFREWVKGASSASEWYKDKDATEVCRPVVPSK